MFVVSDEISTKGQNDYFLNAWPLGSGGQCWGLGCGRWLFIPQTHPVGLFWDTKYTIQHLNLFKLKEDNKMEKHKQQTKHISFAEFNLKLVYMRTYLFICPSLSGEYFDRDKIEIYITFSTHLLLFTLETPLGIPQTSASLILWVHAVSVYCLCQTGLDCSCDVSCDTLPPKLHLSVTQSAACHLAGIGPRVSGLYL